uniref:Uncharacterized protein n=1 Tax=Anas platyrhynchos platyrhynchos TaxID=8840 RepID=A0A493SUS1_ANAPP
MGYRGQGQKVQKVMVQPIVSFLRLAGGGEVGGGRLGPQGARIWGPGGSSRALRPCPGALRPRCGVWGLVPSPELSSPC